MNSDEKLRAAFTSLFSGMIAVQTQPATVTSVDADAGTCGVSFIDDDMADHSDVGLTAGSGTGNGLLILPKVGSVVLVAIINNNPQWAYVSLCTEVEEIRLRGEELGGLIRIDELVINLNKIEKKINSLLSAYDLHTHTDPLSGSTGIPSNAETILSLQETNKEKLQNEKVKHA